MYLVIIAVVGLAFAGLFAHDRIQTGRLDSAKAEVKLANARAADAEAANVTLRDSVEVVRGEIAACNAATDGFRKDADAATKRAMDAIAAKAAAQNAAKLASDALRARAAQPSATGKTCEQEKEEARGILSDLARDVREILGLTPTVEVTGPRRLEPKK